MTPGERNLRIKIDKNKATELRLLKEMSRPKIIISQLPDHTKPGSYYLSQAKDRYQYIQKSKSTRSIISKSPVLTSSRKKLLTNQKPEQQSFQNPALDDSIPSWLQSRPDFQETVKYLKHQQEHRIPEILQINYHNRTQEDSQLLINYLQKIQFFKILPFEAVCETANRLIKESYKKNEKIIRKGDLADGLVLIFKGNAGVIIDGVLVAAKGPGDVVGENALDYRMPRSADVVASNDCIVFKLKSDDYEAAILHSKQKEKQGILDFFQTMGLFQGWSTIKLTRLSALINIKTFEAGENLYKRNDPCTSLYFVKEGKVNAYTYVPIEQSNKWPISVNEWKIHQVNREYLVKIAKLEPGHYFGDVEILKHCNRLLKTVTKTKCVLLELNKSHVFEHFVEADLQNLKEMSYTKIPELKDLQSKLIQDINTKSTCKNALMDAMKINLASLQGRELQVNPKIKKLKNWLVGYKNRQFKSAKDLNNKLVFENSRNISVRKSKN